MRTFWTFAVILVMTMLSVSGCGTDETPVQNAVESTKDALNMREHEKLKDAGEDMGDALEDAVEGIEDAAEGR